METSKRDGFRQIDGCEVCGNKHLASVLDLGSHPLCDDLVPLGESRVCREYPIEILFCETCRTAQQRFQVPKRELFPASYHYRARFTADVLKGMAGLVERCGQRFGSLQARTVLDIGCNDGSLLDFFRERGAQTIGVEPTDAAQEAAARGHAIFPGYLSEELAEKIVAAHGRPHFITFTNVFAHIENFEEVKNSLRYLIDGETIIVIENHYMGSVLAGHQFDTFYHEHARTYSCTSFRYIAQSLGVALLGVEFPARYGGNIRVFLGPPARAAEPDLQHAAMEEREKSFVDEFAQLRRDVETWRVAKSALLREKVEHFGPLPAKAFPARAAILMKLLGLNERSITAVYEKPGSLKIGHYVPATRIPIRSDDELFARKDQTRPLVNLAWHIGREIRDYLSTENYAGPIIDILSKADFSVSALR